MPRTSLHFPAGGVAKRLAYQRQGPYTCADAQNVRPDCTLEERERGGSRPGLELAYSTDMGNQVRLLTLMRTGNSTRTVIAAGTNGNLYYSSSPPAATPAALSTVANMNSLTLPTNRQLMAIDYLQKLYIPAGETGTNGLCSYTLSTDTYAKVTTSGGTIPTNCHGITRYRDRIIQFLDQSSPHTLHASKQGDATNWDTTTSTVDRAWSINAESAGSIGQPVVACIPHADDCLIIGCDSSTYVLRGDVTYGGSVDLLSATTGIVDRLAHCHDDQGWLYWLAPDGLYAMPPGCGSSPISISREMLPKELLNRDRGTYTTTLAYDTRFRGIHIFSTSNSAGSSVHYWVDIKTWGSDSGPRGSFWPEVYASTDYDPHYACQITEFPPTSANNGHVLVGARNGKIYHFAADAADDGGTSFNSYVTYGPMPLGNAGEDGVLTELQVTTDTGSGDVDVEVLVGDSGESALNASARSYEFNKAGANYTKRPRARGNALCLKVKNGEADSPWAVDEVVINRMRAGQRRVRY